MCNLKLFYYGIFFFLTYIYYNKIENLIVVILIMKGRLKK